jgi:acyl-CoA thioester hydrolase
MEAELNEFSHRVSFPVHWGEMDAFQHINNTVFFRYFETGRSHFFNEIMIERNLSGIGPILANASCRFIRPIEFPDTVTVATRLKSTGNSSFVLEHALFSEKKGLAALGEAVIVMYDYNRQSKVALPEHVLKKINNQ